MTKKLNIENSEVEVTFENDKEKLKMNLISLYDKVNALAEIFDKKGIKTSEWFLSQQEINEMKLENKYTFL